MLKTQTFFAHPITKPPPASILEFKNFDSILQKNSVIFRQKQKKRPYPAGSSCAWAGLWPAVTLSLADLFETQCWQPCSLVFEIKKIKDFHM